MGHNQFIGIGLMILGTFVLLYFSKGTAKENDNVRLLFAGWLAAIICLVAGILLFMKNHF